MIRPTGGKYWRYDYRFAGKRKTLALGVYPDISLAQARKEHLAAREGLSEGIDPAEAKKIDKLTKNLVESVTFESIAREWFYQKMQDKKALDAANATIDKITKVISEEIILRGCKTFENGCYKIGRIRDIEIDKDGSIYIITDEMNSPIWKLYN